MKMYSRIYVSLAFVFLPFAILEATRELLFRDRVSINIDRRIAEDLPCKTWMSQWRRVSVKDCSSRGLAKVDGLFDMKTDRNVSIVKLQNNNLTTLPENAFEFVHDQLFAVDLRQNKLREMHPKTFSKLYQLQYLNLTNNKIEYLPGNLFEDLVALQELLLEFNLLSSVPYDALLQLPSLKTLDLGVNPIDSLAMERNHLAWNLSMINLEKLTLCPHKNAPILYLSDTSYQYFNGASINYMDMRFYDKVLVNGSNTFSSLYNLKYLQMCAEEIGDFQSVTSNLTTLRIVCNSRTPQNLTSTYLKPLRNLVVLEVFQMNYHCVAIKDDAFQWIPSIRVLELDLNGLKTISSGAFNHLLQLEELNLESNYLTSVPSAALQVFHGFHLQKLLLWGKSNLIQDIPGEFENLFGSDNLRVLTLGGTNTLHLAGKESRIRSPVRVSTLDLSSTFVPTSPDYKGLEYTLKYFEARFIQSLDLSGNPFVNIPLSILKPMSSLWQLRISRTWFQYSTFSIRIDFTDLYYLKSLKFLDLSSNSPVEHGYCKGLRLSGTIPDMPLLSHLDLSNNCFTYEDLDTFYKGQLPLLKSLKLSLNKLSHLGDETFRQSRSIEILYLDNNAFQTFNFASIDSSSNLRYLDLSYNRLKEFRLILDDFSFLATLNISANSISEMPSSVLNSANHSLSVLNAGGNPFSCECHGDNSFFQHWLLTDTKTRLDFDINKYYVCDKPTSKRGLTLADHHREPYTCPNFYLKISLITITCIGILCVVAASYRYRWRIRYRVFNFRMRFMGQTIDPTFGEEENEETAFGVIRKYDAFVAYDERDEEFIWNEMIPNIEDGADALRLYIGIRDEELAQWRVQAIVDGIERSRKTILVLSPNFVENEWCYFETQIAQQRLFDEGRDVIIPVLLKPIPADRMTHILRKLLRVKSVLEFPNDPVGKELFWEKLNMKIRKPALVNRRIIL